MSGENTFMNTEARYFEEITVLKGIGVLLVLFGHVISMMGSLPNAFLGGGIPSYL